MALYTCDNVITIVKTLIEEAADTNVVTENQLIQFVSDAQIQVATESQCLQSSGTVTLLANTVSYTAPTDMESVVDVIYNYADCGYKSLKKINPGAIPTAADEDYPYFYYYLASKIWIFPPMASVPDTSTVTVLFAKLPTVITTKTDSLSIPDSYQMIVPYKVAMLVALKDNQLEKAAVFDNIIKSFYAGGVTAISQYSSSMPTSNGAPAIG